MKGFSSLVIFLCVADADAQPPLFGLPSDDTLDLGTGVPMPVAISDLPMGLPGMLL